MVILEFLKVMILSVVTGGTIGHLLGDGEKLSKGDKVNAAYYTCNVSHGGQRVHEMTNPTPFDCRDKNCKNTCHGGQCVALVTCTCHRPGTENHPSGTSCWKPGLSVTVKGKCNTKIANRTAIATFNAKGLYYPGHAAIFMGCTKDGAVQVWDQGCCRSVGKSTYKPDHPYSQNFHVISSKCADRPMWPCRYETGGTICCPVSVPQCHTPSTWWKIP